jgi:hypothetical protein
MITGNLQRMKEKLRIRIGREDSGNNAESGVVNRKICGLKRT